jgi:hypothetical protein
MGSHQPKLSREAIITGGLGAGAVAVWFLVRDAALGLPGRTPSILGQVLLFGNQEPVVDSVLLLPLIAYTIVHFASFFLVGALLLWLVARAETHRIFWVALLQLVVVFEFMFLGILMMFRQGTQGLFPAWTVLAANGLALVVMLGYALRTHPGMAVLLFREFRDRSYIEERGS